MNIEELKTYVTQSTRLEEQIERIYYLMDWTLGSDFNGLSVEESWTDGEMDLEKTTITYDSSTWFNGCGAESYSHSFSLNELAQPEEWWVERKEREERERLEAIERQRQAKIHKTEEEAKKAFEQLLAKYPNFKEML